MPGFDDDTLGPDEISVRPTKALFVEMLTRDIPLDNAITDLVDNSVDGARRLRAVGASLSGLWISVVLGADEFRINDNCGGIPIEVARQRAFRFGRRRDDEQTPNSVGQFGVGMKRALFKFGRYFRIESTTTTDRFTLAVDVDDWENEDSPWTFRFDSHETNLAIPEIDTGTRILVNRLRDDARENFGNTTFKNSLSRIVEGTQQEYIARGLQIICAGTTLVSTPWTLLQGGLLQPGYLQRTIDAGGSSVIIRFFVGISDSNPRQAGWYIACNGRTIISANQDDETGWATSAGDVSAPKYHNQFARFRGYVFFDSVDASQLPWNTTKDDVEVDSAVYRYALSLMVQLMRPVIDFLNDLDRESSESEPNTPTGQLQNAIDAARPLNVRKISIQSSFSRPPRVVGPALTTISYMKPRDQVDALKNALTARSNKDLGIKTFDHSYLTLIGESE